MQILSSDSETSAKIFLNLYLFPALILKVKIKPSPSEYSTLLDDTSTS